MLLIGLPEAGLLPAEAAEAEAVGSLRLKRALSVAVSCLADVNPADVLPPITAYYVMKIGTLPLIPYYRPGDKKLAEAVRAVAHKHHAVLLANHGPVVAGSSLAAAGAAIEELRKPQGSTSCCVGTPHAF